MCAQLDTDEALRAVDMGPPAESPKATAFREFWGDRAELRRYKVCSLLPSLAGLPAALPHPQLLQLPPPPQLLAVQQLPLSECGPCGLAACVMGRRMTR